MNSCNIYSLFHILAFLHREVKVRNDYRLMNAKYHIAFALCTERRQVSAENVLFFVIRYTFHKSGESYKAILRTDRLAVTVAFFTLPFFYPSKNVNTD